MAIDAQLSSALFHPVVHARMVPHCAQKGLHIEILQGRDAIARAQKAGWDVEDIQRIQHAQGRALWVTGLDDHTPGLPIVLFEVARSRIVPDGRLIGIEPYSPGHPPRDSRAHMQALFAAEEAAHRSSPQRTRPVYGRSIYDTTPLSPVLAQRLRLAEWVQEVGPEHGPCPAPLPRQAIRIHQAIDLRGSDASLAEVPEGAWLLRDGDGALTTAPAGSRFHSLGPATTPATVLAHKAAYSVTVATALQRSPNGLAAVASIDGQGAEIVFDRQDGAQRPAARFQHLTEAEQALAHQTQRFLDKRASWRNAYQKGAEIAQAFARDSAAQDAARADAQERAATRHKQDQR